MKIATEPSTKWRNDNGPYFEADAASFETSGLFSGIFVRLNTMNAKAKMASAAYINGKTLLICAFLIPSGIRRPVRMITAVPHSELKDPPVWINWLPFLPPPPSLFSIGFTTVFSIHIEKPAMNAPSR